jgi:type II secretory ATPase GspE/PulE/Tfp pilus assembly ATPase PilB-like protein
MVVVPELQDAIQAGLSVREFRRMSLQHGMRSLLDDAIVKLLGGVTSVPEVLRAVGQHAS